MQYLTTSYSVDKKDKTKQDKKKQNKRPIGHSILTKSTSVKFINIVMGVLTELTPNTGCFRCYK